MIKYKIMNNWLQITDNGLKEFNSIEDFPENTFGFIYRIINITDGKFYIGKKQLLSNTTKKLGKKEMALLPNQRGRKTTKKKIIKESDWINYNGSCKPLLEDIKQLGDDKFHREILMLVNTKKELTYWEIAYQIKYDVLRNNSYNNSILGRYFPKDFGS